MNFRKISERGGGVISDPKNFVAFFFALKTPILVMIFRKNIKKGGVISDLKNFIANLVLVQPVWEKNRNIFFRKRGGGGGRGRSEIFRKFIRFGSYRLPFIPAIWPYDLSFPENWNSPSESNKPVLICQICMMSVLALFAWRLDKNCLANKASVDF